LLLAFCYCDGEAIQIAQLMNPVYVARFKAYNIVCGKTPRSCSGVTQSSDLQNTFKAEKKIMKFADDKPYENNILEQRLRAIFLTKHNFSSDMVDLIVTSLQQLVYAAQKTINPLIVAEGYTLFGQQAGHLDFYKIIGACRSQVSVAQKKLMKSLVPQFITIMREKHQITEKEMDDAGIINNNDPHRLPAEDLVVHQKRAVVLNGDYIVQETVDRRERIRLAPLQAQERRENQKRIKAVNQLEAARKASAAALVAQEKAQKKNDALIAKAEAKTLADQQRRKAA
jgi:hypothetical protein